MKSSLKFSKLGEVSEIFAGGDKPSNFSLVKDKGHQVPVFANGETNLGLQGFTDKAKVKQPAVTVSARGTIGYAVLREESFVPIVRLLTLIPDEKKLDVRYLYYYLTLYRQAGLGSSQPQLTVPDIANRKISIHDLSAQQAIGKTLSIFDKKIELNNKINTELEQMAKTLYDYWFVQFDFPDADGKPYKSSGGAMVYNEELKREIPKYWEVKKLGDVLEIYQPQTISDKDCIENGKYFVHGSNGIIGKYDKFNHEESEIIVSCRGDCGNIHRTLPKMWITGNAMVFKMKDKSIHNEFLYQALQYSGIKNISSGSVQSQITRTNVSPLKIIIPEKSILHKYSDISKNIVAKKLLVQEENQKLAELRDWLLPVLMNGQVVIK